VLDLGMTATSVEAIDAWFDGGAAAPARPGGPEWLQAYRDRGYDVVYLSSIPTDWEVGGEPVIPIMEQWLTDHGYPIGDGAHMIMWDMAVTDQVAVYKTQVLVDLAANGVTAWYGYGDDELDVHALRNAGVPAERISTLGAVAGMEGTVPIPSADQDWTAHRTDTVDQLPPACGA
jgi:hypothetical protein